MNAGIHDLGQLAYHGDPCDRPSLSSSIASLLCAASPLHAWTNHPRLNPDYRRAEEPKFDVGRVAHAMILEGRDIVAVVDAADWRTNQAKDERDQARAAGKVPLLAHQYSEVVAMHDAALSQLEAHSADPRPFTNGKPEQTVVFEDNGVLCRALIDWLHDDLACIDDLKTTSRSANPDAYSRALFQVGGDVQAAFYTLAVALATGYQPQFRWVVVETFPPYALSVIQPGPDVLTIGDKKVRYALDVWRRCLEKDEWPGYPADVVYATLPPWEESRWLERELAA